MATTSRLAGGCFEDYMENDILRVQNSYAVLDDNFQELPPLPKRPIVLSWFCVLGFIISLLWILRDIYALSQDSAIITSFGPSNSINPQAIQRLVVTLDTLFACLCLCGAILVWRQQKWGFWLYLGGCCAALIRSLGMYWGLAMRPPTSLYSDVLILFFSLFFIAVYRYYWTYMR